MHMSAGRLLPASDDWVFLFLMIRRPPRSTQSRSSAASDVYKRQDEDVARAPASGCRCGKPLDALIPGIDGALDVGQILSLIHISEPTRPY